MLYCVHLFRANQVVFILGFPWEKAPTSIGVHEKSQNPHNFVVHVPTFHSNVTSDSCILPVPTQPSRWTSACGGIIIGFNTGIQFSHRCRMQCSRIVCLYNGGEHYGGRKMGSTLRKSAAIRRLSPDLRMYDPRESHHKQNSNLSKHIDQRLIGHRYWRQHIIPVLT